MRLPLENIRISRAAMPKGSNISPLLMDELKLQSKYSADFVKSPRKGPLSLNVKRASRKTILVSLTYKHSNGTLDTITREVKIFKPGVVSQITEAMAKLLG